MSIFKKLSITFMCIFALGNVFAGPGGGQGVGHGNMGKGIGGSGSHITGTLPASHPPGLTKTPYGLMQKGITPKGWTKGKKAGWNCSRAGSNLLCVDKFKKNHSCHTINGITYCQP